jgi:FKBP-type peptidyl-prolyl cis-trans isomerase/cyclophilin family peptidyl-prolyl cis-trans isomerase
MKGTSRIVLGALVISVALSGIAFAGQQPPAPQPAGGQPPVVKPAGQPPAAQPAGQPSAPQPAGQPPAPQPTGQTPTTQPAGAQPTTPPPAVPQPATPQPAAPKPEDAAKPKIPDRAYVKMATSMGDIIVELNQEKAPITVQNFLAYVDAGSYNGTIFHRVIPNFMIQGGGFDKDMTEKPTKPGIKNEWQNGLKNTRGALAMARLPGQADSATSQFFINVKDNPQLDVAGRDTAGYAVFGKVISGMEVVDKIKLAPTTTKMVPVPKPADKPEAEAPPLRYENVPAEPVIITTIARAEPEAITDAIAAVRAAEAEEQKKKDEEARKRMEAFKDQWNKGLEFIKGKEFDVAKGVVSGTGLWAGDVVVGTGAAPKPTDKVKVHYTGYLVDGTKFDSSVDRGQPTEFFLNRVVKGWTEGVGGMKVGGKRWLLIPPDLGYGEKGTGKIPPSAVLVFEVELLGIVADQPAAPAAQPGQPQPVTPPAGQPQPAQPKPTTPPPAQPQPVQPKPATPPAGQPQPAQPQPVQPPPPQPKPAEPQPAQPTGGH